MEGEADGPGVAARGAHQGTRLVDADAELAGQRQEGALARHRQPHEQLEVVGTAGGGHDLGQLVRMVEHEAAHAMARDRPRRWRRRS